jgi:hypothetical protein
VVRPGPFVLCLTLLAGACSGGGDDPDPSATPPRPSSTATPAPSPSTTAPADPFAIPEVIDAAYVNRVLAALYAIHGDAVRDVLRTRTVDPRSSKLSDVYAEPQLSREFEGLIRLLQSDPNQFRDSPGNRRVTVVSLEIATPRCIVATVEADFSEVVVVPPSDDPSSRDLVALMPAPPTGGRVTQNPTPWMVALARVINPDESPLEKAPCR